MHFRFMSFFLFLFLFPQTTDSEEVSEEDYSNAYRKHSTEYNSDNSDILIRLCTICGTVENLTSSCPVIFLVFCNLLKTPSTMEVNTLL